MSMEPRPGDIWQRSLIFNPLTYFGVALAVLSVALIATLFVIAMETPSGNPYLGIITYLVLPVFLVLGLLLIPAGMGLENRRRRRLGEAQAALHPPFPRIDLNQPRHQRLFTVWAVSTLAVIAVLGFAGYEAYGFMESVPFCGQTCHQVMAPEKTAYLDSPHARVACTSCHIGPGADWFVRSKLSGVYQVYAVLTNVYPRPIQTPLENLRPARETCEECHWPEKFYGDRIVTHTRFAEDEANTKQKTSLVVKTGGGSERAGVSTGVHWHMDPRNSVEYVATDNARQDIPWVRVRTPDGAETTYVSKKATQTLEQLEATAKRTMDCIDCHNRPTHIYYQPADAIDRSMAAGRIDTSLPFAKKTGMGLITAPYGSQEQAQQAIVAGFEGFYEKTYPQVASSQQAAIERSAQALAEDYTRNVFPQMNVAWGTYVENIGHQRSPGCFRCHDGQHQSTDGKVIKNDCTTCHSLPQTGEPTGLQVAP
ncbi:MAG: cytochrome C, partial [Chloroflexota bacterium]